MTASDLTTIRLGVVGQTVPGSIQPGLGVVEGCRVPGSRVCHRTVPRVWTTTSSLPSSQTDWTAPIAGRKSDSRSFPMDNRWTPACLVTSRVLPSGENPRARIGSWPMSDGKIEVSTREDW